MSVVLFSYKMGSTLSTNLPPKWPAQGKTSTSSGKIDVMFNFLFFLERIIVFLAVGEGTNTSNACSILPMVAEIPQTLALGAMLFILATANSVNTPRLLESNSCHSSTTTQATCLNQREFRFCENKICKVSGVVMSTSGIKRSCFRRLLVGVSPLRTSATQSKPISSNTCCMLFCKSLASERKGLTQTNFRPFL